MRHNFCEPSKLNFHLAVMYAIFRTLGRFYVLNHMIVYKIVHLLMCVANVLESEVKSFTIDSVIRGYHTLQQCLSHCVRDIHNHHDVDPSAVK